MTESRWNEAPTAPDHLFTWVDVDRHFADLASAGRWPGWLYEVASFWDAVRVKVSSGISDDQVWKFLISVLGPLTVDRENRLVLLDSVADLIAVDRSLPIEIERIESQVQADIRPKWGAQRIVKDWFTSRAPGAGRLPHDVAMCVFHSFKGGVGRTLHCVALAHAIAGRKGRVLLVDADLEAPGITWMAQSQGLRMDFSYEDFLALMHGSEDQRYSDAIELGSKFLANQELDGIFLMPSRRNYVHLEPPRIQPADLLTADRDPYVISQILAELAHQVGADVVIVDLRAGISELNAPLLLDPRAHRVIVSTISDQSVRGTQRIIEEVIHRAPPRTGTDDPDISVLLTQFRMPDHESRTRTIVAELSDALGTNSESEGSDLITAELLINIMLSRFDPRFLNLPASWSDVRDVIVEGRLEEAVAGLGHAVCKYSLKAC